jgi:alkylresorcinol/alkylpyrone synthase
MRIVSVGRAFPEHHYGQDELLAAFREHWAPRVFNPARLEQIHRNVLVGGRYLTLPIEGYRELRSFAQSNAIYVRTAIELGARATLEALGGVDLTPASIDHVFFATVTGIATPSIDARLVNRLGLREDVKRTPVFGLGCVAGAACIARAADYLRAFPEHAALVLSVELCSLTLQPEDFSIPNLIASGLFGDGAAAVLLLGERHPRALAAADRGPAVVATRSRFYRDTEEAMGWEITDRGFKIVLSDEVPRLVRRELRADVERLLAPLGLARRDLASVVGHPGGPKILRAVEEALDLPPAALELSWRHLAAVGNLSSASVLMVLGDTIALRRPPPGALGLLFAMGPGFCSELVLLRW